MSIERNSHPLWWLQSSKTENIKLAVMTSLYTFLPILRKLNVNSIFFRIFSPTFISVPKTFSVVELISKFRNFRYFRYSNGQLCNGRPKYGHIRHQRFQINQCFVFQFLQILVLTVFPFFRRPFWIEDMNGKRWFAIPYKAMSWRM